MRSIDPRFTIPTNLAGGGGSSPAELVGAVQTYDTVQTATVTVVAEVYATTNLLVVGVTAFGTSNQITGASYGGVAMTASTQVKPSTARATRMFWMLNPPVGIANLAVTYVGGTGSGTGIVAQCFKTTNPTQIQEGTSNPGTNNAPSVTLVTGGANRLIVDIDSTSSATSQVINGTGHTLIVNLAVTMNSLRLAMGYVLVPSAASVTLGWNAITAQLQGMVAEEFR